MKNNLERRYVRGTEVRYVRGVDGGKDKIQGYAAVFNQLSEDLGGFREKIDPGAFSEVLEGDTRALKNHNSDYVLGRTTSGTLKLKEDDTGLRYEIVPPDTQWAKDLMVSIDRGDITQSSFGFRVADDKWETQGEENIRTIIKIAELPDVSPVTYPAYPDTNVQIRSIFTSAGINYDEFSRALIRTQRKLELTEQDKQSIKTIIDTLLPLIAIDEEGRNQGVQTPKLDALREKLEQKILKGGI